MINKLNELITDLRASKRPVFMIGGGARDSGIEQLLARISIPAFPTWNALDIVTSDMSTCYGRIGTYGGAGRNFGIQNCDLLICLGTRVSGRITGGKPETFTRAAKRWFIDTEIRWNPVFFHEWIECKAVTFVDALLAALKDEWLPDWIEWGAQCRLWRELYDPVKPEFFSGKTIHPYGFARLLSREADNDAIIVTDCGGNVVVMNHAFETQRGQRYFSNNGNSPMGFSMCGALGAWFAAQERQVICVIGDGGFNMNIQELQTLVNYGINIKIFIFDNRVYGITKAFQRTNKGGRYEACGPVGYTPPDFKAICEAYQVRVIVSRYPETMQDDIRGAFDHEGPVVVIVECPEFSTYEPRISGWSTPIEDMTPLLPDAEFASNMLIPALPR